MCMYTHTHRNWQQSTDNDKSGKWDYIKKCEESGPKDDGILLPTVDPRVKNTDNNPPVCKCLRGDVMLSMSLPAYT